MSEDKKQQEEQINELTEEQLEAVVGGAGAQRGFGGRDREDEDSSRHRGR